MGIKRRVNPHHLSSTGERYTPPETVAFIREVMGRIDFDPASCAKANEIVGATHYLTREDDALESSWNYGTRGIVNCPSSCKDERGRFTRCWKPGRKRCTCAYVNRFWVRTYQAIAHNELEVICWVGFHCNQLQSLQQYDPHPLHFATVFPRSRIPYLDSELSPLKQPPQASYITLLTRRRRDVISRFLDLASKVGAVTVPHTVLRTGDVRKNF